MISAILETGQLIKELRDRHDSALEILEKKVNGKNNTEESEAQDGEPGDS